MSPKSCSLAVDDMELEKDFLEEEDHCDPVLTVLVNKRKVENSSENDCIQVTGRINVSF